MSCYTFYRYLDIGGEKLFTVIMLPGKNGKYPTVICRSPYVNDMVGMSEDAIIKEYLNTYRSWLGRGYAIVYQHCRGRGKSSGYFVPYIFEREDGLETRKWIRSQPFYNGELFLLGASYSASLHYSTAPFEDDIRGAVFEVQDSERYNLWYRNGQMRKGHANWHFGLFKWNSGLKKCFDFNSFSELPLKNLSERVLGERADDFEQMLFAGNPSDDFWNTRFGGAEARNALIKADIPILLTTGYNDYYIGGIFRMWEALDEKTKEKSALLVSPYNHGDWIACENAPRFHNGRRSEQFGSSYQIDWFDNIRNGCALPFKKGKITFYRTFEDRWGSDFYDGHTEYIPVKLGNETRMFQYNPQHPTAFSGEGTIPQDRVSEGGYIRVFSGPFDSDLFVKGRMKAKLAVSSDCEDTSFYIRISIKKQDYTYVLRHDITSLCFQPGGYVPNEIKILEFSFDEYAFLLEKGDRLQIDIAATDDNTYVSHTNKRGEYCLQAETVISKSKVYLDRSYLFLPIEQK